MPSAGSLRSIKRVGWEQFTVNNLILLGMSACWWTNFERCAACHSGAVIFPHKKTPSGACQWQ